MIDPEIGFLIAGNTEADATALMTQRFKVNPKEIISIKPDKAPTFDTKQIKNKFTDEGDDEGEPYKSENKIGDFKHAAPKWEQDKPKFNSFKK
jgi:hypothetical protein